MTAVPLDAFDETPELTALRREASRAEKRSAVTTALAQQDTVLSPRFYTTDFEAMDRIDVSPVREAWDGLMAEMAADLNKSHFKRDASFEGVIEALPEDLIRRIAKYCVRELRKREGSSFW